jgi:hypothetical protein
MKKKELLIVICLLALFAAFFLFRFLGNRNAEMVLIKDLDTGKVVLKVPLDEEGYYTLDGKYGKFNIEVKDSRVRAIDVECPNHNCEMMGYISRDVLGTNAIICIPNGFEVTIGE